MKLTLAAEPHFCDDLLFSEQRPNFSFGICIVYVCLYDRNGVKLLLGAGALYVTVNEGVWSTSESGLNAAQHLQKILPETTQYWKKVIYHSVYQQQILI